MKRERMLQTLRSSPDGWGVIIIGGGSTGLGAAIDAASRGVRTLLLEQGDFAQGTSSRSTKLVHGGVRYLRQGNLPLVREALRERELLLENAPHVVHKRAFVVPNYGWMSGMFYFAGLKMYDYLAGNLQFGSSRLLTREETLRHLPTLRTQGLTGGVLYYDGQFDDARLALNLAQTVADLDGTIINYMQVIRLLKQDGRVVGAVARDRESGEEHEIRGAVVVNATGVFADWVRKLDDPGAAESITSSQGAHIVLDRSFLDGDSALLIPETEDGRVLFAIPWHGRLLVGTTDTPVSRIDFEPRPLEVEIEYLLRYTGRYLTHTPTADDVLSTFAGQRPLVKPPADTRSTASLSREHAVFVSPSGLVTVTGGKWTTYREMGKDTIDTAAEVAGMRLRPSATEELEIHGSAATSDEDRWGIYGSDARKLEVVAAERPEYSELLHTGLGIYAAQVIWAARGEMARTVEDVLSRRTRALLLDARASIEIAPRVAALLARELGRDSSWEQEQVERYCALAEGYLLN